MKLQTYIVRFAMLVIIIIIAGCGENNSKEDSVEAGGHVHSAPNGDVREMTDSAEKLPQFLSGKPTELVNIYRLAEANADLLEWIPCYCGCGVSAGHRNNLQCFVHERRDDGSLIWDDHGTRCGVCQDIAFQAAKLQREGQSVQDIRKWVDDRYSALNVEPTPTPIPQ